MAAVAVTKAAWNCFPSKGIRFLPAAIGFCCERRRFCSFLSLWAEFLVAKNVAKVPVWRVSWLFCWQPYSNTHTHSHTQIKWMKENLDYSSLLSVSVFPKARSLHWRQPFAVVRVEIEKGNNQDNAVSKIISISDCFVLMFFCLCYCRYL